MKYITHRRFKAKAMCGNVNLPARTECDCDGITIKYEDKELCSVGSENAHQYFAVNEDGMGLERGKLTQAIQKTLAKRDNDYQARWEKVWEDAVCQPYKRKEYADYWLWNTQFFSAPIEDLQHIARLVGCRK